MPDQTHSRRKLLNKEQRWRKKKLKVKNHPHKSTTRLVPVVVNNNHKDKFASQYYLKKIKTILNCKDVVILAMVAPAAGIQDRNHSLDLINSHAKKR